MITSKAYNILKLLEKGTYYDGICAKWISWRIWKDDAERQYLAYTRKGWLCVGSYIGKLRKKGYVDYDKNFNGYYLTNLGKEKIREYDLR